LGQNKTSLTKPEKKKRRRRKKKKRRRRKGLTRPEWKKEKGKGE
jgi:hypothetical protein